jgi:RimJ/RimL family protein N-acetyltransferase
MDEPELQPNLIGRLVSLRPLRADDFEPLHAVASDPLIWAQHPDRDRWRVEVFRAMFEGGLRGGGALLILDAATGAVAGSSRYYEWDPAAREVAIGYTFLARRYWGGAHNREVKRLMLRHAFGFADAVWFHVGLCNGRSQAAMARIGATRVREVLADPARGGRDMVYFRIRRDDPAVHRNPEPA